MNDPAPQPLFENNSSPTFTSPTGGRPSANTSKNPLKDTPKKSRGRLKALAITLGIIITAALITVGLATYHYLQTINSPSQPSGDLVDLTIAPGSTSDQITQQLLDKDLIQNDLYFKIYLRLNPTVSTIQAGDFAIPQNISIKQLVQRLTMATRQQAIITFPEGLRREEMAEIIDQMYQQQQVAFSGPEFSNLALNPNPSLRAKLGNRLPVDASLQGYLFPDTYHLDADATAEDLIVKMLDNYLAKVTSEIQRGMANQDLTEYQALILAAIVERESYAGDERPIIGYIMLERLRIGEILGVDATLQYALGYSKSEDRWWRQNITLQDLELDSPYNTRRRTGLPPAPIANPGLEAIKAIAMPQPTDYLYYLHDPQGRIHYAQTLDEHNANVARYLQ